MLISVITATPAGFTSFTLPPWALTILGFIIAFTITYIGIPIIIKGAFSTGIYAKPNRRASHNSPVPKLGGVAVFTGFIISINIIAGAYFRFESSYFLTGLIIIFIMGLKDDIMGGKPWKKMLAQITAVLLISILADIRISNLHGFLGIGDIHYTSSIIFTVFVLIVIINGFNLIDGIDGLASGTGILISSILGLWFFITGNKACSVMSFALAGSLIAFFYFNVFSKKNKIFLGDTGSMITGIILGVLAVRFLQLELSVQGTFRINSAPAFAISLFILPLFDTLRVFTIRIFQGTSPFKADRQHIHHRLLELGLTHLQATLALLAVNLIFIAVSYLLHNLGNLYLIGIQLMLAALLSYLLLILIKSKMNNKKAIHLLKHRPVSK